MATHSSILTWRIPTDGGALEGYSPRGRKESDMTEATKHSTAYLRLHSMQYYLETNHWVTCFLDASSQVSYRPFRCVLNRNLSSTSRKQLPFLLCFPSQ